MPAGSATPADIDRNGRPTSVGTGGRHQAGITGRLQRNAQICGLGLFFGSSPTSIRMNLACLQPVDTQRPNRRHFFAQDRTWDLAGWFGA